MERGLASGFHEEEASKRSSTYYPQLITDQKIYNEPLERKELMTITIDLGNGRMENIVVMERDDPMELAQRFALKHGLNERLQNLLALQIQNNVDSLVNEGQFEEYQFA
mmetsp:Transcript_34058/g.33253  ORF Transcript_34058/g.33253 Transcript_34058/m.33253 type:complete len:109 (+) Transcript_34058:303-629(+)